MSNITLDSLLKLKQNELDDLYKQTTIGGCPVGATKGTAVFVPSTAFGAFLRGVARMFFWQGKVFDDKAKQLVNLVSIFRIKAIRANVYPGTSWLDGGESTILDYSKTSFVARMIRDEIREVAPDLYLGKVYLGKKKILDFILEGQPAQK
jgi:hypothetical protein